MPKKRQIGPSETITLGVGQDRELRITPDELDHLLSEAIPGQIAVREHQVVVESGRKRRRGS